MLVQPLQYPLIPCPAVKVDLVSPHVEHGHGLVGEAEGVQQVRVHVGQDLKDTVAFLMKYTGRKKLLEL